MFEKLSQTINNFFAKPADIEKVIDKSITDWQEQTHYEVGDGLNAVPLPAIDPSEVQEVKPDKLMSEMQDTQSDCDRTTLDMSAYFDGAGKAVEVPACMSLFIEHLWRNKIKTVRSYCCGDCLSDVYIENPVGEGFHQCVVVIEDCEQLAAAKRVAEMYPTLNVELVSA